MRNIRMNAAMLLASEDVSDYAEQLRKAATRGFLFSSFFKYDPLKTQELTAIEVLELIKTRYEK